MSIVRDRADARWLPSRFNFALSKLFAYARLRTAKPQPQPGLALSIERHQNATENYAVAIIGFIVLAAFVTSLLAASLPLGTACLVAVPVTAVVVNVQVVGVGAALMPIVRKFSRTRPEIGITINSAITAAIVIAAAALLAAGVSPLRHIGWAFLVLVAANALAAICVLMLQRSIAEMERPYGVDA